MKIIEGDLLKLAQQGEFDIIVQGCNCFNTMGSGLAKQIKQQYPDAYVVDKRTISGDINKLGTYTIMFGETFDIVNAYTQYNYNTNGDKKDLFEYTAFELILQKLAIQFPDSHFGFPMIGCGLAGGSKSRILSMLERFHWVIEKTGGSVTVVEFAV